MFEGERLALTLMEELREQIQVLRVRVLFGFVAYGQFTGIAMTAGTKSSPRRASGDVNGMA